MPFGLSTEEGMMVLIISYLLCAVATVAYVRWEERQTVAWRILVGDPDFTDGQVALLALAWPVTMGIRLASLLLRKP